MGSIRKPIEPTGVQNNVAQPGELTIIDGKYQLIRRIAVGGASEVFEARHLVLGTELAVKIMLPQFVGDEEALIRMKREATLTATSKSENVLKATDAGMIGDRFYIITEFLKGCDLRQLLACHGPLELGKALYIVNEACAGVAWAHEHWHAAHRDLKPENIHVAWNYDVKILDFGIAKLYETLGTSRCLTDDRRTPGTLPYSCPAALRGLAPAGYLSDIFAMGVVLYELLAGRHPGAFGAMSFPPSHQQREFQLRWEIEPLPKLRPGVPESLWRVIQKACAKDPRDRYQSIREFQKALLAEYEKLEGPHVAVLVTRSPVAVDIHAPAWTTDDTAPSVPAMERRSGDDWREHPTPIEVPHPGGPRREPAGDSVRHAEELHLPRPSKGKPLLPDAYAEDHPAHAPPRPIVPKAQETSVVLRDHAPHPSPPRQETPDPGLAGQVLPTSLNPNAKGVLVENSPPQPLSIASRSASNWWHQVDARRRLRRLWLHRSVLALAVLGCCVAGVSLSYVVRRVGARRTMLEAVPVLSSHVVPASVVSRLLIPTKPEDTAVPEQPTQTPLIVVADTTERPAGGEPAPPTAVDPVLPVPIKRRAPAAGSVSATNGTPSAPQDRPSSIPGSPAKGQPAKAASASPSPRASSNPPMPARPRQPFSHITF